MILMKNRNIFLMTLVVSLILSVSVVSAKEILVKKIKFSGLKYVSKYELISGVKISSSSNGILIDRDALDERLSDLSLVKDFTIIKKGSTLIISIIEEEPQFLIFVQGKNRSLFLEIDENYNIISKNNIHRSDLPVITVNKEFLKDNIVGLEIQQVIKLLQKTKNKYNRLYNEIEEIDCSDIVLVKMKLKNRKTKFFFKLSEKSIRKIVYLTGYFDRIKEYPDNIYIDDKMPSMSDK